MQALNKLSHEKLPVKVAWNIQRIMRQMEKEVLAGREFYKTILQDTCEVDEKGEVVWKKDAQGNTIFGEPIPKDLEIFKAKNKEFMDLEIEIKSNFIMLKDFGNLQISSSDLMALEPLICEMEVVE